MTCDIHHFSQNSHVVIVTAGSDPEFVIVVVTIPETNNELTPEIGWLEYDSFLLREKAYFESELLVLGRGISSIVGKENLNQPTIDFQKTFPGKTQDIS